MRAEVQCHCRDSGISTTTCACCSHMPTCLLKVVAQHPTHCFIWLKAACWDCTLHHTVNSKGPMPYLASLVLSSLFSACSCCISRWAFNSCCAVLPLAPWSALMSARLAASSVRANCAASLQEKQVVIWPGYRQGCQMAALHEHCLKQAYMQFLHTPHISTF